MSKNESQNKSVDLADDKELGFALPKRNILYIIAGFVVMLLGYALMSGGGSDDPNIFNSEMFSARRIVVAPVVILAGICVVIWGIMYKGKNS